MKVFILALLALAATTAIAQLETTCSQGFAQSQQQQQPGQRQMQEQKNPCLVYQQQMCTPLRMPFLQTQVEQLSSCQIAQYQCCQQSEQIPEPTRCHAIHNVAEAIIQQQSQQQRQELQQQAQQNSISMLLENLSLMCIIYVPKQCQQQQQLGQQQQQQLQEQSIRCTIFLQQQCSPVTEPFPQIPVDQHIRCQNVQQQCCRQLSQIPEQFRCQAIHNVADAITQQQPQQQRQGMSQPQQPAQLESIRMSLQALRSMCSMFNPVQCPAPTVYNIPWVATYTGGAC
uniref:Avenin-like protein n=1 Tax=Oryza sativa subsp. indica TaxID=39946 RepID=A7XUR0_ORYSI|nr:avenin-like protein [Oryza sativa Indica Group]